MAHSAVNTVGFPNILWRAKITGQNNLWYMNGTAYESETPIMATGGPDHDWKITGVANFDGSGTATDIIWQHETVDANAVWFMNGISFGSSLLLLSTGDRNWDMAAIADFNRDGKADIIWQYRNSTMVAVWLMNGTANPWYAALLGQQPSDANWRVVGAGDFNGDGVPDLVWRNRFDGQNAIWYMGGVNGIEYQGSALINAVENDQDWKICGTGDFNGDTKADLLWRYTTLGVDAIWFMDNSLLTSATYFRHLKDPAWKIATQDTSQSTWRQSAESPHETVSGTVVGSQITLNYTINPSGGNGVTIQRREPPATAWQTLASGWQPGLVTSSYTDSAVQPNRLYEYKIYRDGATRHQRIMSGINVSLSSAGARGRLVLLIDSNIVAHLGTSLTTLRKDLIGEGWTLAEYIVPRHDDSNSIGGQAINRDNLSNNKSLIVSEYVNNQAKGVLIIGHVTIPYSGESAHDSHTDHEGAWTADMYYGDINSDLWTDLTVSNTRSRYPENWNIVGDGKFDLDYALSSLELFVG